MATKEFRAAVQKLSTLARASRTALMCAEKFYWKCHQRLLSDYLTAQGAEPEHIMEPDIMPPHKLAAGAVITPDAMVIYPPGQMGQRACMSFLALDAHVEIG